MELGVKFLVFLLVFISFLGLVSGSYVRYGYNRYIESETVMPIHTWSAYNYAMRDLGNYSTNRDFSYWLNSSTEGFSVDFYYESQSGNYNLDLVFNDGLGGYILVELRNVDGNMRLVVIVNGSTEINTALDSGTHNPLYVDFDRVGNNTTIRVSFIKNGKIVSRHVGANIGKKIQIWAEAYGDDITAEVFWIKNVRIYWVEDYSIEMYRRIDVQLPLFLIMVEVGGLIGWIIVRD